MFLSVSLNRDVIKNGYFTVRLTVRVDPPPYGQLFVIFLVYEKNRCFLV